MDDTDRCCASDTRPSGCSTASRFTRVETKRRPNFGDELASPFGCTLKTCTVGEWSLRCWLLHKRIALSINRHEEPEQEEGGKDGVRLPRSQLETIGSLTPLPPSLTSRTSYLPCWTAITFFFILAPGVGRYNTRCPICEGAQECVV
jgi:hypothetical protein